MWKYRRATSSLLRAEQRFRSLCVSRAHRAGSSQWRAPRESSCTHGYVSGGQRQGQEAGWLSRRGSNMVATSHHSPGAASWVAKHQLEHVDQLRRGWFAKKLLERSSPVARSLHGGCALTSALLSMTCVRVTPSLGCTMSPIRSVPSWGRRRALGAPSAAPAAPHGSAPAPAAPLGTENAAKSGRYRSRRPAATR